MSNDPPALSGIGAGLPQEAEFDAVYAAVTATERGRWFLTEYSSRNRHADINSLVNAIARIEAVVRNDTIGSERTGAPDIHAATERIADIAIGLRDRAADLALCDALDAAVRELCQAVGSSAANHDAKDAATKAAMIAAARTAPLDEELPSSTGSFDLEMPDSDEFARAATALAASLGALTDDAETARQAQSISALTVITHHDDQAGSEPQPVEPANHAPRWYIAPPDFVLHPTRREADARAVESPSQSGLTDSPAAQFLPDPQDDPADLFESALGRAAILPHSSLPPAAKPAPMTPMHAASTPANVLEAVQSPSPQSPAGPTVTAMPRPAPVSPLAALRALSEEELIALFG